MLTFPLMLAALSAGLAGGVHCVGMCGGIASMLSRPPSRSSSVVNGAVKGAEGKRTSTVGRVISIAVEPVGAGGVGGTGGTAQLNAATSASASIVSAGKIRQSLPTYAIALHAGRLFTYMLIGAVLGGLGTAGLLFQPYLPVQTFFFTVGNAALILLGCRLLGLLPKRLPWEGVLLTVQKWGAALLPALQSAREHPFLVGMGWGGLPCGLLYAVAPFAWFSGDPLSGAAIMLLFGLAALPHLLITQRLARLSRGSTHAAWQGLRRLSALLLIGIGAAGLFYFDMHNMPKFLCIT